MSLRNFISIDRLYFILFFWGGEEMDTLEWVVYFFLDFLLVTLVHFLQSIRISFFSACRYVIRDGILTFIICQFFIYFQGPLFILFFLFRRPISSNLLFFSFRMHCILQACILYMSCHIVYYKYNTIRYDTIHACIQCSLFFCPKVWH
ncbi:hypothetical protein BCR41DRAFT_201601 [Lobosporangium transversale]|uniref:Uncharacterized protein n=1 Tax=Lobosporangium transversale TaxID=64571 RepID=A0A1Y2GW86_9FUNG|nr:hypothetical protein BCR41DRAFT_201601 [Lobosporangium transversale]ORZ26566.1 hypothetical protein BCR41DRAFT_201601 [Lobosporangium transversale]|eukprot:XP_021884329.1 hypothetical protein BCR41DRAFT_201601 [Lobosporangium transversale]